ncbi:MAG: formimidoylglutamate deiminase [Fulvimarina manganoxydans]|uniref:formimidoylglutamate deiminase n=1 Tax=Fulvimarina manganoxydans TaxID=937218 RepID=UPI0023575C76|nr:formimidoylglutamate deiminase [Fulvimarina manganoxydans]MCK5934391.1 formimidoylglutamate deiminase [Fulvimarina manganoxydans]
MSSKPTAIHAKTALLEDGFADNVRVMLSGPTIAAVETGCQPAPGDERVDILLPGMANLHSHAFQRAMAGLAEVRGPGRDTFWTWRDLMYRVALTLDPDDVSAVAAQLYAEMLEGGFTRVGEFHYLHHAPDGSPYADRAELAGSIVEASQTAGLGLTLIPVLYAHSDFGGARPSDGQRRFINDREGFAHLLDASEAKLSGLEGACLGVAAHSLRAATPEEVSFAASLRPHAPFHMHISEQVKEVEDCIAWSGQRPVEWLLENETVDQRWCLIHATHMTADETVSLAQSGAVAGLCPVTEANLGDGVFNAPDFLAAGGQFGTGSDSNILIGVADELRQLEYAQRLFHRARNIIAPHGASNGRTLFEAALKGAARATGIEGEAGIQPGALADLVSLDANHPALIGRKDDSLLDAFIFGASRSPIDKVWALGRKQVEAGRHLASDAIFARFRSAIERLSHRL